MTREQQEWEYYCLDRCKPISEEFTITYDDGGCLHKTLYKIGLKANIKHTECYCLYTESENDLDTFLFIPVEIYNNYQKSFFFDIFKLDDIKELIKSIKTINIFEFTSLLDFTNIYQDFKDLVEENWNILKMDNLIEI
ncbi:MAG: hypothetical protein VZS44_08210 [Bacilli bacterium]|nr:hypothetical protein [Bacilli bacterium]